MSKKLTIVVTCTDRKATQPLPQHQARHLPAGPVEQRAAMWVDIMSQATDSQPLRHLYRGEAWHQVGRLEAAAHAKGFDPEILVASAGLGLRRIDSVAPSYAATFSGGHADSVGESRAETQSWWEHVSRMPSSLRLQEALAGPTLLVLSEVYASALSVDLERLHDRDDVVIFGGRAGLLEDQRFPANVGLRNVLGGTAVSLNTRMAIAWLQHQKSVDMRASRHRQAWIAWSSEVESTTTYDRRVIDDAGLQAWIRAASHTRPDLSKTAALRMLRDSGVACEQRRFGMMFAQTMEEA